MICYVGAAGHAGTLKKVVLLFLLAVSHPWMSCGRPYAPPPSLKPGVLEDDTGHGLFSRVRCMWKHEGI